MTINMFFADLSAEAYFLAKRAQTEPNKNLVRITSDLKEAYTLKQNLEFFLADPKRLLFFPPLDTLPYTGIIPGPDIIAERLATLHQLQSGRPFLLVVPVQALLRKVIPPRIFREARRTLRLNQTIERAELISWLVDHGYQSEVLVESPGDFALRGGLIDIFAPQENFPVRLEFDGDCLTTIRPFDPATQTTLQTHDAVRTTLRQSSGQAHDEILLIPASEILYNECFVRSALKKLKQIADEQELPATLRREVAEKIEAKLDFPGKETFLPCFYEESATVLDYLGSETQHFLPDFTSLKLEAQKWLKEMEQLYHDTKGIERLIVPCQLFVPLPDVSRCPTPGRATLWSSAELKRQWSIQQLKKWRSERFKIRLVCHTEIQANRLSDLLKGQEIFDLAVETGKLSNGFGWLEEGLIILTEEEIFGHKTIRQTKSSKLAKVFTPFAELTVGDHLVHEEHGICRYHGLQHLKIGSVMGDYLELEFLGKDKLFLPIYRMNIIQRYVGGAGGTSAPPLDSLRGTRWRRVRARARKEVFRIAAELLKIHAERELHAGCAFPPPDSLDEEFASHFPYDETPDQAQAIEDVFRDMQRPKPMDRLICGDVGYGKTEVAMRSAFKAVSAGKQAALLVPTTILALQHYETFLERFDKLAISVAMLSRFSSKKEQKETLARLARGQLDIVIGTHRLLMEDVKFKNLGLLIIDEEHRFGVRHKERIKKMRPTVDVLTLSATPIPRTLHMSLIGLRDFSMIHTPPVDRHAIRTFLARFDEALVKHAISQELARGGQVFFVHNRVATIAGLFRRLQTLLPEAKIAIAHGQMQERELEKVMIDFLHQRTQILLTTTIIESGIDVPNANTMLIHRADTFGLAQLYQLRGRVGRSDRQAYCYLLVPEEETLTAEARGRLTVLTRYSELGAGFQIASHDLEIRGAGNLLGTSQAGFIEEIGYELYTKLLARTIRSLKGEKIEEEVDPEIKLNVEAYIPETYVNDTHLRMSFYKRMAHLSSERDIAAMEAELADRFGKLPEPARNLFEILRLKQQAVKLKLPSLKAKTIAEAKKVLRMAAKFLLLWMLACTPSQPSSPTLAQIAEQTVTLAEFQKYLGTEQWKFGVNPPALTKEKLLDNFLKDHLLLMEAKKRGIEVSPQEVDQSVKKFKAHYPKPEDFEKLLTLKGWTLKDFNDRQAQELTIQKLVDAVVAEQLELSEKDLQHYYDQHRKTFRRGEEVHARQIVTDSSEKAEALREMLAKGAAFEEAALKYSLSPDRKQGGDLGWFERGVMPKEFDAVCFALPAGELSPVIKTPYGFHLFQVLEKRPPRQLTFAEVQDEIRERLKSEQGRAVFQKWYEALRAQTEVKIDAEIFNQIK